MYKSIKKPLQQIAGAFLLHKYSISPFITLDTNNLQSTGIFDCGLQQVIEVIAGSSLKMT